MYQLLTVTHIAYVDCHMYRTDRYLGVICLYIIASPSFTLLFHSLLVCLEWIVFIKPFWYHFILFKNYHGWRQFSTLLTKLSSENVPVYCVYYRLYMKPLFVREKVCLRLWVCVLLLENVVFRVITISVCMTPEYIVWMLMFSIQV